MAYLALNTFAGTGALMQVELSFAGYNASDPSAPAPYFNVADIKAVVVTPATSTTVETETPIGLTKINTMTFKTVSAVPIGKNLRVYRETNISTPIVDFVSLQVVSERDLDNSTKQTLYAVMEAKDQAELAGATADTASAAATAATGTANAALSTANTAKNTADTALTNANAAVNVAGQAVGTANAASTAAGQAASLATQAAADAAAVVGVANSANSNAATALQTANTAKTTADGIAATANNANSNASTALSTANDAKTTANGIAATANQASQDANQALSAASQAQSTANGVAGQAQNALDTANTANTKAQQALDGVANANTSNVAEGTNLYFTQNRVRSTVMTGVSFATNAIVAATDTLLAAIGKLQAQISDRFTKAEVNALVGTRGRSFNILDNSNFVISQRGQTSLSSAAAGTYFLDRWKAATASTTVSRAQNASPDGDFGLTVSTGSIMQIIDADAVRGGTYTFKQEGTASATIQRNSVTLATIPGGSSATFSIDRVGLTSLAITFGTGTVIRPQLEEGTVSTPYQRKQHSVEQTQCYRYFYRGMPPGANFSGQVSGAYQSWRIYWPVQMVGTPTLSSFTTGWVLSNIASAAFDAPTSWHCRWLVQCTTAGNAAIDFQTTNWLQASCEP